MIILRLGTCVALILAMGCSGRKPQASDPPSIIPVPGTLELRDESGFRITAETSLQFSSSTGEAERIATILRDLLSPSLDGLAEPRALGGSSETLSNAIALEISDADASPDDESYTIDIDEERVLLHANTPHGLFNAVQTLRQLLPATIEGDATAVDGLDLPAVHISDAPRFGWRGLMLDTSRWFLPKSYVFATIDRLALYKMNVLHLHLTDDQGWRIEVTGFPSLHEQGSVWSDEHPDEVSGYYTQDDIREIVAYAQERFIEVVPEIDMPGHVIALLHSLPELACAFGSEPRTADDFPIVPYSQGITIHDEVLCVCDPDIYPTLFGILDEVLELFPSEYVHLGGDETPTDEWERSPECEALIEDGTIARIGDAHAYFSRRMQEYLTGKGKRYIGWTEVLSNEQEADAEQALDETFITMHWLAMNEPPPGLFDRDVIHAPMFEYYLDWYNTTDLEAVYAYDPEPAGLTEEQRARLRGAQACMWNGFETTRTLELQDIHIYPKLLAVAESVWSPADAKNWSDFERRLDVHSERLERLGVTLGECENCVF